MELDLASRVLRPAILQLLKRIMRGSDELPPVLACVVEADSAMGNAAAIQLAIRRAVVVRTLQHVLRQSVLMLHLLAGARGGGAQEDLLQELRGTPVGLSLGCPLCG